MASTISAGTSAGTAIAISGDTSGALQLQTNGTTTAVTIDTSQNVGIGTTSPTAKLQVNGGVTMATSNWFSYGTDNTFYSDSSYGLVIKAPATSNFIAFRSSNDTDRMRIDSSGNVGIGTNSPATKLQVSGDVTIYGTPSSTVQGVQFRNLFNTGAHLFSQGAATTNTYINWINANGTVGSIAATGSGVAYNTSSDYRLKNTIAPMTGALDKVALLKPCTYKWNADGSDGQGFIAHELDAVVPGCVSGEKDATREEEYEVTPAVPAVVDAEGVETTPAVQAVKGTRTVPSYQGIDTSFLVATLTAAIQEQQAIIIQLQADVAALQGVKA